jgi:mRNA-degrading endonuclease RelE of RelBE toxin-antitoxin system
VTIYPEKSFLRAYKKLGLSDQTQVRAALAKLPQLIGKAHEHHGTSVRRLNPGVFELRVGLRFRVIFTLSRDIAILWTVGDHDHVQAWLRNIK